MTKLTLTARARLEPWANVSYVQPEEEMDMTEMYQAFLEYKRLERERDAARAALDATCSPESFADLVRQRTELIAERDELRKVASELLEAMQQMGYLSPWLRRKEAALRTLIDRGAPK